MVTAGFGDALTTALDVMTFAHDLDLSTATEGIPTNIDAKQSKPKSATKEQTKSTVNNQQNVTTNIEPLKSTTENVDDQTNNSREKKVTSQVAAVHEMNLKNANRK